MDESERSTGSAGSRRRGLLFHRTSGWLIATLTSTILAFFAATTFEQARTAAIHDLATNMATVTAPSIELVARARGDLRRVQTLLTIYLTQLEEGPDKLAPANIDFAEIDRMRRVFRRNVDEYLALPVTPGEELFRAQIESDTVKIDDAVRRIGALVEAGDVPAARRLLRKDLIPRAEAMGYTLVGAIDVNGERVRSSAEAIERSRVQTMRIAYLLDGLCVLLAVLAGFIALRAIKKYADLLDDHQRRLELHNEELVLFAARVAHDIRGPLTPVRIAVDMGRKQASDPQSKSAFGAAARSLHRVEALITGLLDYAKAGAGVNPDARARIAEVLQGVLEDESPNAQAADIDVRVDLDDLPPVRCSEAVLTSILSNLVRNAIKFMGSAKVRVVTVRAKAIDGRARIEVRDTGPGFPPEITTSIFEPYVRGNGVTAPGLGLGLATVKRLVVAHGGKVGAESIPGEGACFWVELPLAV